MPIVYCESVSDPLCHLAGQFMHSGGFQYLFILQHGRFDAKLQGYKNTKTLCIVTSKIVPLWTFQLGYFFGIVSGFLGTKALFCYSIQCTVLQVEIASS